MAPILAAAQAPPWPTPQDIDRALKANPFPGNARLDSQPVAQPPRLDPQRSGIDIDALLRGKPPLPQNAAISVAGTAPLHVFVTLDMPRVSLQRLTDQASRSGAVLVLRGLKSQSMRETLQAVSELIGSRQVAWVIDPDAFTRYGVEKAPTFVLHLNESDARSSIRRCTDGCATPTAFVSVAGDVSLDYALEALLRGRPDAAPVVAPMLKRLRPS